MAFIYAGLRWKDTPERFLLRYLKEDSFLRLEAASLVFETFQKMGASLKSTVAPNEKGCQYFHDTVITLFPLEV